MNKTLCMLTLLTCYVPHIYAKLIVGDPNATSGTTFSFNVGFTQFDDKSDNSPARWWIATDDPSIAGQPDETKIYGLSLIEQAASYFDPRYSITATPMTNKEDATVFSFDGTTVTANSEANPLWGGVFSRFDISNHKPIFTLSTAPNLLYSVQNIERYAQSRSKANITELLVHDFGVGEEIQAVRGYNDSIYAAYSTGSFGTGASSIALAQRTTQTSTTDGQTLPCLKLLATLPIDVNTDALIGGNGQPSLASFGPSVKLDITFNTLFLGLQATSAAGGIAVGVAKVITNAQEDKAAKVVTYSLTLAQLAPTAVLTAGFDTAISAQNGNSIRITGIAGLQTSTNVPYMIIGRDNSAGPETIYALPLTPMGTIADFTSIKTTYGSPQPIFTNRYFDQNISDANQINPANPNIINQIRVGGASTLPIDSGQSLKKIFTVGDCVYAVIGGLYTATQLPGTYRSQAIFAPEGHIIGWTAWSRVLGSDKQMNYGFVDYKTLTGLYVAAEAPSSTPNFNSVYQTTFDATSNLTPFLNVAQGAPEGLQGLFDFNQTTPGFNSAISMLIGTAFNKITMGQTGETAAGIFGIKTMSSADVITFTGEAFNNHQAMVAAEIAHNGTNHFIFAGGSSGLSVLSDDTTGVTWTGSLTDITGLSAGQTWKKLGDFTFIKKLVWDDIYLYILTSDKLYRISLDETKFTANSTTPLDADVILVAKDLNANGYFLDLIMDNGFGLLGTTSGLYSLNGSTASPVIIPQGLPAVSKIIAIAPNQNPQRSFKTLSNIYILNNTFGTQQARIHRFAIQNGAITHLPDSCIAKPGSNSEGTPSAFIIFNNYISNYFTDGSWNIAHSYFTGLSQPEGLDSTPFVQQILAIVRSGLSSSKTIMPLYVAYAPLPFIKQTTNILAMTRESTSGAVIAAGAFQAHTNA